MGTDRDIPTEATWLDLVAALGIVAALALAAGVCLTIGTLAELLDRVRRALEGA